MARLGRLVDGSMSLILELAMPALRRPDGEPLLQPMLPGPGCRPPASAPRIHRILDPASTTERIRRRAGIGPGTGRTVEERSFLEEGIVLEEGLVGKEGWAGLSETKNSGEIKKQTDHARKADPFY